MTDNTRVYNMDCMLGMREFPDKYFELAIVDPPYGIGVNQMNMGGRNTVRPDARNWDTETPDAPYFEELFRVAKNQIIWGGNYFDLPPSKCFIIWDKGETMYERDFAECEQAWASYDKPARMYKRNPNQPERIHPTQKPVALYKWLLKNYAKEGDKILDTHGGSMSSVIACLDMGFPITCYEIDTDYYNAGKNRIINHLNQLNAFRPAYEIEFHDSTGVSTIRNQQGSGYKEQNNGENKEPIHRIDGLFHGDSAQKE